METEQKKITLSEDQEKALEEILKWYKQDEERGTLSLGGYAGTGKSTLLGFIRDEISEELPVRFLSLTGKAVSVMQKKLDEIGAVRYGDSVQTIHSYMYRPVIKNGKVTDWVKKLMDSKDGFGDEPWLYAEYADLFVNDEASMTSGELYDDLKEYGRPILAVGDHGQLPPVKSRFNLMEDPQVRLENIHRQAEDNPILKWATMSRRGMDLPRTKLSDVVMKMGKNEAKQSGIIEDLMLNPSPEVVMIVAYNRERVGINQRVRSMLKYDPKMPVKGDRVICLRNDREAGIYNGLIATINSISNYDDYNYRMNVTEDYGRTFDVLACKHTFNNVKGEDPEDVEFYHFKTRWDYAYAITCHKSQGSEFDKVIIMGQWFGEDKYRWLYTAITRAKKELYIIQ